MMELNDLKCSVINGMSKQKRISGKTSMSLFQNNYACPNYNDMIRKMQFEND